VVGWRGAEDHFMKRLHGKLQMNLPVHLVGQDDIAETQTNLQAGLGMIGPFTSATEGFSNFMATENLEAFLSESLQF